MKETLYKKIHKTNGSSTVRPFKKTSWANLIKANPDELPDDFVDKYFTLDERRRLCKAWSDVEVYYKYEAVEDK
jgi:hypothetical protein